MSSINRIVVSQADGYRDCFQLLRTACANRAEVKPYARSASTIMTSREFIENSSAHDQVLIFSLILNSVTSTVSSDPSLSARCFILSAIQIS